VPSRRIVRSLLAVVAIVLCLWAIKSTAASGVNRILIRYALIARDLDAARDASRIAPNDAQAHNAAATLANLAGSKAEVLASLENGVALRPADYTLWLALGLERDEIRDQTGALKALDESVRLAPFYAAPRWQRGNVLLRAGRVDEAFVDLNWAAASDPELGARIVDLAWSISSRDPYQTERLVEMRTPQMRLAFARVLLREKMFIDAVRQFEITGYHNDAINQEMILGLLSQGAYWEAREVWQVSQHSQNLPPIYDGGFETALSLNEKAFGWRIPSELKGAQVRLDAVDRQSGEQSLLIEFSGEPPASFLSQLVVVEPNSSYRLNFAVRAANIVSGGPPVMTVHDAGNQALLGQSERLQTAAGGWRLMSFEFKTGPNTRAVMIGLGREACATAPCPIFGSLSLDSFSLERVN